MTLSNSLLAVWLALSDCCSVSWRMTRVHSRRAPCKHCRTTTAVLCKCSHARRYAFTMKGSFRKIVCRLVGCCTAQLLN